jgi:hypothetical protein
MSISSSVLLIGLFMRLLSFYPDLFQTLSYVSWVIETFPFVSFCLALQYLNRLFLELIIRICNRVQ